MRTGLPTPTSLEKWLSDPVGLLGFYQQKAKNLIHLNQLWQKQVDSGLVANSRIANFERTIVVIEVDSSVWASRLHYWIPELLPQLKTWPALEQLIDIKWYIKPKSEDTCWVKPLRRIRPLSPENKALLQSVAKTIANPNLQEALGNLAQQE